MASITKKITCPFCFEQFRPDAVEFRCANPRCKREQDRIYERSRGHSAPPMGHVFAGEQRGWTSRLLRIRTSAKCDECRKESSKRLCPHCHFELSHDAGLINDRVIAIIGGKQTGKGHYIATLIHRLEQEVGSQFGFSLRMLGDDTRERFENDYRDPLFRRRILLKPTQSVEVEVQSKLPMIFRLTFKDGRRRRAVNLSFFDAAGEDMQSLDILSTEARYICFSAGIIFLLDPLQIDAIRQRLPAEMLPPRDPKGEPVYIEERLRELFERQFKLSATDKIKTPVAFALSKVDALLPIVDAGSALNMTGEHFGYFNQDDAQSVHTEIWNYLESWMGGGFSNRVETDFQSFHYFGVSSLGATPNRDDTVETISPIRVEDPFLWILYRLGIIKGG